MYQLINGVIVLEKTLLTTKNLYKEYTGEIPFKALDGIDFELEENEFVAIMGPSGSGKTTFLNTISTLDSPTNGTVEINGKNPFRLSDEELANFRRTEMGFVFQDFNLVDTLTVKENILLPLVLEGISKKEMRQKLNDIVSFLGIKELLNKRTYEISGGQKQRVAIARSVIHRPNLLLADEPTGNLDSKAVNDVMTLFSEINTSLHTAILMVTHDPYVASFSKRVIFIKDGQLYNEIHCGNNRKQFYQEIMDMLTFLGGGQRDI